MPKKRMSKLKLLLLLLTLTGFSNLSFGQDRKVTGSVFDENNNPMKGATVSVKESKVATSTDAKGDFIITMPQGKNILLFSFVGYEAEEFKLSNESNINIYLKPTTITLNNVVVNALGFEARRDKLGSSSSKINGDQVANSGEANLIDAMGGKASGVRISRSSGSDEPRRTTARGSRPSGPAGGA